MFFAFSNEDLLTFSSHIMNDLPRYQTTILRQVRIGKKAPLAASGLVSAIDKQPLQGPVVVSDVAVVGDEYGAPELHGGAEQAILHYPQQHYAYWQRRYPLRAERMQAGGFGENFVADGFDESNICIGDVIAVGSVRLQVSMPRQPCIRLNHRFDIPGMAVTVQQIKKTGWYYRVLQPGLVSASDVMSVIERPYPEWTISRIQHYLYDETNNTQVMQVLSQLDVLAPLMRNLFAQRLTRVTTEDWQSRLGARGVDSVAVIEHATSAGRIPLRVEQITEESDTVRSYLLASIDGQPLPAAEPGAHIMVHLPGPLVRQYSLCPSEDASQYRIAVARAADSRGGSHWLHETLAVGDILDCSAPRNSFPVAKQGTYHVMFAGGIGITPFLSMISHFQESQQKYRLYYLGRRRHSLAFTEQLATRCGDDLVIHVTSEQGGNRLDIAGIIDTLPSDTHVYCCGPDSMVQEVRNATGKVPAENIHIESFAPPKDANVHHGYTAVVESSGRRIAIRPRESLLYALRREGIDVPSSCETGSCGTCVVGYRDAQVHHEDSCLSEKARGEYLAICVSRAASDSITLAL